MSEPARQSGPPHATRHPTYLAKDDLLALHALIIERYGGRLGVSSLDRLIGALDAPRQVLFGAELYPDLPSKAAALTFLLLKSRPFVSANQSTALLAMLRFLNLNDLTLRPAISSADLLWLIRAVDTSALDKAQLETWLRENIIADV